MRGLRGFCRITLLRAFTSPTLDQIQLFVGEPARSGEVTEAGFGRPWGHEPAARDGRDLGGSLGNVVVCEQGKRRNFAWAVTGGAIRIDDWRDLGGPGNGFGGRRSEEYQKSW